MNARRSYLTLSLLLLTFLFPVPTWAGFEEGFEAAKRGDYVTALKEWRPLAEQGDANAQFNLGVLYGNGQGIPQNFQEALGWLRLAAEQGEAKSQHILGSMYQSGKGVPQDFQEAARWYRLAAEQGEARAQGLLGSRYFEGKGVPQDYVLAHMWFNLSAAQGAQLAAELRDAVAKHMTPAQIAEAQRLAREWKPKN